MPLALVQVALVSSSLLLQVAAIPLEEFYPFGVGSGDLQLPANDDGSTGPITLSLPFPFFASAHTTLFVSEINLAIFILEEQIL